MRTSSALGGLLFATLLVFAALLQACSGPWLQVRHVPEDGYERTLNYQFQARVHSDSLGDCHMLVVRVKPLNKMYSKQEPPSRLQLFDDDCMSPLRFERIQYHSKGNGSLVRLAGPEVTQFLSEYDRLEGELVGWLWRAGVI